MLTLHYEAIQTAFASLKDKSKVLALHVLDDLKTLPLWVNENKPGSNAGFTNNRDLVIHALSSFHPDPSKTPQETFICQSVVMANMNTHKLVSAVNDAKNAFKRACLDYRAIQSSHSKYAKEIRKILSFAGLGHISLKHAYRNLVYLDYQPRSVSWALYNKSSIKTIRVDDAKKLLLDLGAENPAIEIQLSKLNLLDINDKLAIKTVSKPYSSANVFKHDEGDPQLITTSLPIFIKHDPCLPLPIIKLSSTRTKNTKPRSDRLLEPQPFLNSINAFRYNA